jgi:hypothetical protein
MSVITRGDRELGLRFEKFPTQAHAKLEEHMRKLVDALQARVEAAAPRGKTGRLKTEIKGRVFADSPSRVAGYVEVYAPGVPGEYAKAATLEYGTDKPRRVFERTGGLLARVGAGRRRIVARVSKPVHIRAFRYLRGSIEGMRPEVEAELALALAEAAGENTA